MIFGGVHRWGGIAGAVLAAVCAGGARGQIVSSPGVAGGVGTSLQVSTLTTGTSLGVTSGVVSPDGRYVGIGIDVQFSTLEGLDTYRLTNAVTGPGATGGAGVAAVMRPGYVLRVPFRPSQVGRVILVNHDKALLAAPVPALVMKGASLKAAVRKLADVTKGNFVLGVRAFEAEKIDLNAPRDFNIPAGNVQDALLAIMKMGAPETDLVITAEDKVVSIATQAQADKTIVTKNYYLQDLIANIPRYVAANTDMNTLGSKRVDGKTPSSSTTIVDLITSTVRPEIWKVNGGKYGEIAAFGNHVTITAPQSVHALLDGPKVYNPNQAPLYVNYGQ